MKFHTDVKTIMFAVWAAAWLWAASMPAAHALAPLVSSPLSGAVTTGSWQYGDLPYSGMSGGAMHYAYLLPYNYSAANTYPVLVYEHENDEGNNWYLYGGDPTQNTIVYQNVIDGTFNTVAFRTAHPCIVIVPYCDQTDGTGGSSGQNFGGYNDNGFTNVNENAVVAVVRYFESNYSVYPYKVYITGDSLGGIGTEAAMLDFNAINGPVGNVYTAGLPFSGEVALRNPDPATDPATISRMYSVPMFMVSGSQDTTSNPNTFNRPWWQDMSGNSNYPAPPGAEAGGSGLWYLEDPNLGHDVWDTYRQMNADGGNGDSLYAWLFSQTSPGAPSGGGPSGYYRLVCQNGGLALSTNNSTSAGTAVIQDTSNAGWWDQEWSFVQDSDGAYRIINLNSGLGLSVNNSTSAGTTVIQDTSNAGWWDQEWNLVQNSDGTDSFINQSSGMALSTNNSTSAGTVAIQDTSNAGWWDQEFNLVPD